MRNSMRLLHSLLLCAMVMVLPANGQNSKKVKNLKAQKTQLQKELKKSQTALANNKADVKKRQQMISYLDGQIAVSLTNIRRTEAELDSLDREVKALEREIAELDSIINDKKAKYTRTLRLAQSYSKVQSPLLFALSAKNVTQMYRRLRYTREYASYERNIGEQLQEKQAELMEKQNMLLKLKSEVNAKMQMLMAERAKLNRQQVQQREIVAGLKKAQAGLQKEIGKKEKEISALQKKIDEVVAYEIEQARKKAEEEARRRAAAEAKKKAAGGKTGSSGSSSSSASSSSTSSGSSAGRWLTAEEKALNGTFEQNKGRLPVPITGQYMLGAHYGSNISGAAHVVLDNKGTNYVGRPGARARSIYDGVVSTVFSFGGMKNVLVRHGSYISVYCNLSSVIVAKGQKVKARDILGTIANDGDGNCTLHFQLRKETARLNPEAWIGR